MTVTAADEQIRTLDFSKDQRIEAAIEVVFETLLEEIGPGNEGPPGQKMPMKLEAWPGGRWVRDLGQNAGHLWGHVQVIKPPTLLEICGPMFMSYPAAGHIAYRLKADGKATVLTLRHRAFGQIPEDHIAGVRMGWGQMLERIAKAAMKR
jgi:hypothetical protein